MIARRLMMTFSAFTSKGQTLKMIKPVVNARFMSIHLFLDGIPEGIPEGMMSEKLRDDEYEIEEFGDDADDMGADDYPYHRKEQLKPKDIRKMRRERAQGTIAQQNVAAAIAEYQYKKAYKQY